MMKEWELKGRFICDKNGIFEDDFLIDVITTMSGFLRGRTSVDDFNNRWNKFHSLLVGAWVKKNGKQAEEWMKKNRPEEMKEKEGGGMSDIYKKDEWFQEKEKTGRKKWEFR